MTSRISRRRKGLTLKINTKFAISNIIMLAAPIFCIGVISIFCIIMFVLKFPVEELHITRTSLINPAVLINAIGVWLRNNPDAYVYILIWALLCLSVLAVFVTFMTQLLSISVQKPIRDLNAAANEIKNGNLSFNVLGSEYDEINELCQSFDNMRLELKLSRKRTQEMNAERNMLLANISHDLKTPITSIIGYIEGINDGLCDTPEKMNLYLNTIYKKTQLINDMVNNLSTYSKLELSRLEFNFSECDLNAFVKDFLADYALDLERNNLSLKTDFSPAPLPVKADLEKLSRVLSNVINNSIKYMDGESGKLFVHTYSADNGAYIEISDDGIGIAEEELEKVFEGFYRVDSSRNLNKSGSGLGLGIAKQIVERHGGKMWIRSQEKGIMNIIYLPMINGGKYEHDTDNRG